MQNNQISQKYTDKITNKTLTFVRHVSNKNLMLVRHTDGSFQMVFKSMLKPVIQ
jgi:uncharacterized membrane-anchored protein